MPLLLYPFVGRERTGLHHIGVHAGGFPPKAAAPRRRAPVGLLIPHQQIVRGANDSRTLERISPAEHDAADRQTPGAVRMMSQEEAIVPIADQVAVKVPLPGSAIVQPLAADGGIVK